MWIQIRWMYNLLPPGSGSINSELRFRLRILIFNQRYEEIYEKSSKSYNF
jgi:hypothetical protein